MMECRRVTNEKGPYPSGVGGNIIEWGREPSGCGSRVHEVDFAGPLVRIAYGAFAGDGGIRHAYRLFFADGTVFEIV
jgi:hypothetical protein